MHVASSPFTVVAVIVAVPALLAVITPSATAATSSSLLVHDNVFACVVFSGNIVAAKVAFFPAFIVITF